MGENPGFLRRYCAGIFSRRQKAMNKFVAEMRLRRHADDDILSPAVRADLDALIDEARSADPGRMKELAERYARIAPPYRHRKIRELLDLLLVVGAVAFGIRGLYFQPFRIPTSSMQPTLYGIHFMERENATNPLLGKLPQPINWLLFSARPAKLEVRAEGELDLNSFRRAGDGVSDSTAFRIGPVEYKLPGDFRKVEEYSNLELSRPYRPGEVVCDGFLSLGDHLFVERFSLYLFPLRRGNIVVFNTDGLIADNRKLSDVSGYYYIKRLVGLPGDTLKIVDNVLQVKPRGAKEFKPIYELDPVFEKLYSGKGGYQGHLNFMGHHLAEPGSEYVVPEDHYFMMGDNSQFSLDSRFFGAVPRENLVGKAWIVFWPFSRRWGRIDRVGPVDAPTGEARRGTFPVMYRQ